MRIGLIGRAATVFATLMMAAPVASGQVLEKSNVVIAVSGPPAQIYFLPVVLAKHLGYFDQAGVNVELQLCVPKTSSVLIS
jgi:ABC-type nitrate/sulfonate/bicarbonate transport system substrate-binding protein